MGRPKYLNDGAEGQSNHRPEGLAEEERHPFSTSGPPLRPERSLRLQPPPDDLSDQKAWPKRYFRLRPGYGKTLLTALLR